MDAAAIKKPRLRTITCLGFDWRAEVSLKQTLALLSGKTFDQWRYSDELIADVVVYNGGNALAQAMIRRAAADGVDRIFLPSSGDGDHESNLRYPFGASVLIRRLNDASDRLAGSGSHPANDQAESLCQRIDAAMGTAGARTVLLQAGGKTGWLQLADRQLYWPNEMGLDEVAQLLSSEVIVRPIGSDEDDVLRALRNTAYRATHSEPLLWAIGIGRSNGALLDRLTPPRPFRLRRWPNFGAIGKRDSDLRCASFLTQRELSPDHLSTLTSMPVSVINTFLNACALCGLLEEASTDASSASFQRPPPITNDSRLGGMLRRIRQAFALQA